MRLGRRCGQCLIIMSPARLTMITRIAGDSQGGTMSHQHLNIISNPVPAYHYRWEWFPLMKSVSLQQFDIQMMPNGNLICLIIPGPVERASELCILSVLGAELTMASNQHPLPTGTVGDWSFQHCPRHQRYRYLCWRGGGEVCHISADH